MVRIFLTGYMGAGKTTLGKAFARKFLAVAFYVFAYYAQKLAPRHKHKAFAEQLF